jgi:F-type H+-transporting ATPase subunit epsilon
MPLELTIVTADKRIHFGQLRQVVFSTPQGQVGIFPGHTPLVCQVASGVLRVCGGLAADSARPQVFAIASGLARVAGDRVTLLVTEVLAVEEIDRERVEELWREEAARIAARKVPFGPFEREDLEEEARFCAAQLEAVEFHCRENGGG